MISKAERKGKRTLVYGKYKVLKYIHKCKDCECEILLTKGEEKIAKGYCKVCIHKHRNIIKTCKFNELGEKHCKCCDRYLPVNKFIKRTDRNNIHNGYMSLCSKCHNLKKFGISSLEYEKLSKEQNHKCAICGNPEYAKDKHKVYSRQLAVDHCHTSKKIRGLLCTKCNVSIGHFKDDIELLQKAIDYIKSFQIK